MAYWTYRHLAAAVEAYRRMQERSTVGRKLIKVQIYRDLSLRQRRTPKAWEDRIQNTSHVLHELKPL